MIGAADLKILVIGGGGREHAVIWKLAQSRHKPVLYAAPGNAGIAAHAQCLPITAADLDGICQWAGENKPDLVFVAPDDPLALGLVDRLEELGIPAFGPRKNAAVLESSKVFSKAFMQRHNIPTARYQAFDCEQNALAYIRQHPLPLVIKADGLALGKGVVIAQTLETAEATVMSMMRGEAFGDSGRQLVIEEHMTGPEVTVLAFTDGKTVFPMPASRDHKRAFDGDEGPNTGGMGAICPASYYTRETAEICMRSIFIPTVGGMAAERRPFQGVLYFGLMLTPDGPRVIEYNARLGDPEAQVVLPLLKTDLIDLCFAVREGRLRHMRPEWHDRASACVVLAGSGYPGATAKGLPVTGLDTVKNTTVFHAGTALRGGITVTNGGRVLGVTAWADDLPQALEAVYGEIDNIKFDGCFYRKDIGKL
jgi:phosphoribosylamine--glycine ligase